MTTTGTKSRASRAAAQAAKDAAAKAAAEQPQPDAPESDATPQPEQQPETAANPKPAKPKEPTATAKRAAVFAALLRVAGDLLDRWDDDDSPAIEARDLSVTAEFARETIAHRMSYIPSALDSIWDSRLGPCPIGRGKFPTADGGQ